MGDNKPEDGLSEAEREDIREIVREELKRAGAELAEILEEDLDDN